MHIPFENIHRVLQAGWQKQLPDAADIMNAITISTIESGAQVMCAGLGKYQLGFLLSGSLRVFYKCNNKEVNIRFLLDNDTVLDFNPFVTQNNYTFYTEALEKSEVLIFDLNKFFAVESTEYIHSGLNKLVTDAIIQISTTHMGANLFLSGEARYLKLFTESPEYFNRIPLYHIASYLGMEKESLSRIRRNIIDKNKRKHLAA
jgi:CRP/FNR family transcriptional regulator, anaerobic regulatory protein